MRTFNIKSIIITLFVFSISQINGQQIPLSSGYMVNPYLLSPSFAGEMPLGQNGRVMALSRLQFAQIEGAPVTYLASADANFQGQKMGLGAVVYSDSYGLLNQTGVNLSYAYRTSLGSHTQLSMGLSAELMQHGIDFDKINAVDNNDDILNLSSANKTLFNGSFGIHLKHNGFQLGFVSPQVVGTRLVHKDYVSNTEIDYEFQRHYIGFMGYSFETDNQKWQFDPMVVMRTGQNMRPQFDVMFKSTYQDQVFGMFGYRSDYAMSFGGGVILNRALFIIYNYDLPINDIAGFAGGAHEFGLAFNFNGNSFQSPNIDYRETKAQKEGNLKLLEEVKKLREEVESGKENFEVQKAEIERLNKKLESYEVELDSIQNSSKNQLKKLVELELNNAENVEKKEEESSKSYYLVIASLKSQKEAYEYQQSLRRNGDQRTTFLKQSNSGTWFFVCQEKFSKANEAKSALDQELKNFNKDSYLTPWIYFD
ncbi:MAG: PorP/SprF family type IX secretion system membrane protein [Bacteroidia bacterium]